MNQEEMIVIKPQRRQIGRMSEVDEKPSLPLRANAEATFTHTGERYTQRGSVLSRD